MPSNPKQTASRIATRSSPKEADAAGPEIAGSGHGNSTPPRRRLRSDQSQVTESPMSTPMKRKSPRLCINSSPNSPNICQQGGVKEHSDKIIKLSRSPAKMLLYSSGPKQQWNPRDPQHMGAVKKAMHVSIIPHSIVCREAEQQRVFEFCKGCVQQGKSGSLYLSGCPGTGKSLSVEKVKHDLLEWAQDAGFQAPDVLSVECTSLATTSEIFRKILGKFQMKGKANDVTSPLQHLQKMYTQKQPPTTADGKMMLVIADELDYLITKDRAVLHDLFMLTALPFSRCILIGIANAIDLVDRFLPRLQSLNCKPLVITFPAYSKDQILEILQERLNGLPFVVFQREALELCARRIAAASGDMRKALDICRSAIDLVEAEVNETAGDMNISLIDSENPRVEETATVRIHHMALALSRAFRSPTVDIIQSLPQHQQITLCSVLKLVRGRKKDTNIGELYKSYVEVCKELRIPGVGNLEFSSVCEALNDQGVLKLGQSRNSNLRKITPKVEEADITFALQGICIFRNCLQQL
ncbi:hypothetical protein SAY87_015901 [Trapa incisa]|uniref:Cell division control protein n=1 Tax=Trapa incisa TaxID=236973 RepID=A0AAN7QXK9_9MYRT|nr:hypothetical protein SAY87_015901 [Trapa incisa]